MPDPSPLARLEARADALVAQAQALDPDDASRELQRVRLSPEEHEQLVQDIRAARARLRPAPTSRRH